MFEVAEVGRTLSKKDFDRVEPEIHLRLLNLQDKLRNSNRSLIIIVAGVEGAGKSVVVTRLNRWFDARDIQTHAFWDETDEERERPKFWRYWRTLPARGLISIMFGSWYTEPIARRVFGQVSESEFELEIQRIEDLEKTLVVDGAIIVKLWFHLSKEQQNKRHARDKDAPAFKKSPFFDVFARHYDEIISVASHTIRLTDADYAPWHIIEASDDQYRDVAVGQILVSALEDALTEQSETAISEAVDQKNKLEKVLKKQSAKTTVLDTVDLSQELNGADYEKKLTSAQQKLNEFSWKMHQQEQNAVMVFEGWDAAGKGGAIRRLTAAMDARIYRVIRVGKPSDEELAHHYLWRFWRHVPRAGNMTLYDRSWYGRVLVERVEGLIDRRTWHRAYNEINNFEEHLVNHGIPVFKFWIHISEDEQLKRFRAREQKAVKQHKITTEDWRNRKHWEEYEFAINEMIARTSTENARWHLIAGNDKRFARVRILELVCEGLGKLVKNEKSSDKT